MGLPLGLCRSFLMQCNLVFDQHLLSYGTDGAKIAYLMGLLRGNVLAWATAVKEQQLWMERGVLPAAFCHGLSVLIKDE